MEQYEYKTPSQIASLTIHLSSEAIRWLNGTTKDNDDRIISHHSIFFDLLSRIKTEKCTDISFRRPQVLEAGQAQFSEFQLSKEWNMGRKKIHNLLTTMQEFRLIELYNSRTASLLSFGCIRDWELGGTNPPEVCSQR